MKIKIQHMDIVKHPALLVLKNQDFFTILGIVGNCFFMGYNHSAYGG